MLISEITVDDLKDYAQVDFTDDDYLFYSILQACKTYISNYTGLPLTRLTTVPVVDPIPPGATTITGTSIDGYTVTVTFPNNATVSVNAQSNTTWSVDVPVSETLNVGDEVTVTQTNPSGNVSAPTVTPVSNGSIIHPKCVDDFEDLSIALMVLSNEMYENRIFTVQDNKVNNVIKSILDMHSVNFL